MHYNRDAPAIVLIVQGNGCQIVQSFLNDYRALRDDYAEAGVQVMMINSNLQDSRETIAAEAEQWDIDFPILDDDTQAIGRSLGVTRTAEVIVVNPKTWRLVYRGPLNDRVHYERQRTAADERHVRYVLDSLVSGEVPEYTERCGPGCIVNIA